MAREKTSREDQDVKRVNMVFDGEEQECEAYVDQNGETVVEVINGDLKGRFAKFPKGADLNKSVREWNAINARD